MVLKTRRNCRKIFLILFLFLAALDTWPEESTSTEAWWPTTIQTAFSNSSKIASLINEYQSYVVQKKQYDYSWFPVIQTGIQNTFNLRRSDYLYVLNQTQVLDSEHTILMSPAATISIIQKLPGNGQISFKADYAFSYFPKKRAFIQYPNLELNFSQNLFRGAFGITKDPEILLLQEQLSYSRLLLENNLFEELKNIISLIASVDTFFSQEEYYKALSKQYESEAATAKEKNQSGLQSGLEAFYAAHQFVNTSDKLNNIIFDKDEVLTNLLLIVPDFDYTQMKSKRNDFKKLVLQIFNDLTPYLQNEESFNLSQNTESLLYTSLLNQYKFQFQNEGKQSSPVLYLSSSISPDNSFNSYYSDWYKSFRNLNERPYPFVFSFAVGIYKSFEIQKAKTFRKEIYNLYCDSINNEMQVTQASQKNRLLILLKQIETDTEYLDNLELQLQDESDFRAERIKLYEQELITSDEFYKSETMYYLIYTDFIETFWKTIKNQLDIIDICARNDELMKTLLGAAYEKYF